MVMVVKWKVSVENSIATTTEVMKAANRPKAQWAMSSMTSWGIFAKSFHAGADFSASGLFERFLASASRVAGSDRNRWKQITVGRGLLVVAARVQSLAVGLPSFKGVGGSLACAAWFRDWQVNGNSKLRPPARPNGATRDRDCGHSSRDRGRGKLNVRLVLFGDDDREHDHEEQASYEGAQHDDRGVAVESVDRNGHAGTIGHGPSSEVGRQVGRLEDRGFIERKGPADRFDLEY